MATEFLKPLALGLANTPVNVGTALTTAGFQGFFGLAELTITNDSSEAGNLTISTNSAAAAETDGEPFQSLSFVSGGSDNDTVNPFNFYLLSSTASKKYFLYARSKV